jgi:hypothetical protein
MTALMKMAYEEMKNDNIAFACLSGHRQRYEYYDYTPAGSVYNFDIKQAESELKILRFTNPDENWFDFVCMNRKDSYE